MKGELVPETTAPATEVESEVREKNQITVPKRITDVLGARTGDRFVWVVEEGERGVVSLHRLQSSYAGSLAGVYDSPHEADAYLTAERESWDE